MLHGGTCTDWSILLTRAQSVFTNSEQLKLIAALAETNFVAAEQLLKSIPIDFKGTNGGTVLWWEANVGNFAAFDYLLKKGAKPVQWITDTYNTLELCAMQDDPRFLQAVIIYGANINTIGHFTHQTAIFSAINARIYANVEILIEKGAHLNVADPTGITPLIWASESRAFDLMVLLLKHGANPGFGSRAGP